MRLLSLFAGAGGMDLGFVQAGHEIVWANDNDSDAVATYRKNLGDHIVEGPIEGIATKEIPDGDVVIGGFPCQGFSRANMKRSPEDSRNRLYLELVRVIEAKQPRYFAAENVRGLLSLEGGRVMDMIVEDFRRVGYNVRYRVFNMADYGVPQTRRRVIILGNRKDLPPDQHWGFPAPTHDRRAEGDLQRWLTIQDALEGLPEPDDDHQLLNHICSQYKVTNRDFTGHRRTDPHKPSPTILARGNGGGGVCAIQHPRNHRRLSVRESALVQTFPVDFEFVGAMNSMYRQVGNAVPPRFAKQLAEQLPRYSAHVEAA
jgi:DNA (cytosine-5)-methyltransferase 1